MAKTTSGKNSKKLSGFFVNNQNKPRPIVIILVIALFATVGAKLLFSAFALGETMSATTPNTNIDVGANFVVTIQENSGTTPINFAEADIIYDSTKLQYVSSTAPNNAGSFDTTFANSNFLDTTVAPNVNKVKIARGKQSTNLTGTQTLGTITFKALAQGATPLTFATCVTTTNCALNTSSVINPTTTPSATNVLSSGSTSPLNLTISDLSAPTVPTVSANGAVTETTVPFKWTAATDNVGVVNYQVFRGGTQIATVTSPTLTYTDTGRSPSTPYSYTVKACDAIPNQCSAASNVFNATTIADTTKPSLPGSVTVGTRTETSIVVNWTAATDNVGVSGYNVYRSDLQTTTSTSCTTTYTKLTATPLSAATLTYTSSSLTPGKPWCYKVTAVDNPPASNESTVPTAPQLTTSTLADTTNPTAPNSVTSPSQTTNSINLSWSGATDNVGIQGYNVYFAVKTAATCPTGAYASKANATLNTATSFSQSGLTQGTTYCYKITTVDTSNNESAQPTNPQLEIATTSKPGDTDSDGDVDSADLATVVSFFGRATTGGNSQGDFNNSGYVDGFDASVILTYFGT